MTDNNTEAKGSFLQSAVNKSQNQKEQIIISSVEIKPPVVIFADMNTEMKEFAFEKAELAIKLVYKGDLKYYKDVAQSLKEQFDEKFGGTWHVVVGRHFGSFVTYESKCVIQFWINQFSFFIYKFG
ncbi:hypothetical protein IMG5_187620 [Ichthyophthirius multifiliis]|uniref:Dynein light chain n=1 Tax=Ichthyophthirius multifiliis TaxID=5932 RepID=G0R3V0_ICHMU|nr:hypothetical protein IMG5_187620 [Ichthyophthirius multifiliis]EGR27857.1 hypothetical protein IMG5_187620 [Ichthyophthirius multifiliis]|eukprot:XP_004027202.1 hypothetical protein IMG5_187620 [Ichthyophthirius multifiliis]